MAKKGSAFETEDEGTTTPKTKTPKAKAVSPRRMAARTKYKTVVEIMESEDAVTEKTTVGELLGVLKERVFEEAI